VTRGERPLLSVLMPVYNEVGTVEAAIDAVLAAERPSPLG
jgi:glycosyltransferase involved in cell wall biosynthesis